MNLFPAYEWWDGGSSITFKMGITSIISVWTFLAHHPNPCRWVPPPREMHFAVSTAKGCMVLAMGNPGLEPTPVNEPFDYLAVFIIESKESFVFFHFWLPKLFCLKTQQRIIGFGFCKMKNKFGW